MSQNLTEFEPNENQERVLEAFQDSGFTISVVKACQAAGISRNAYYLWFQDEGFRGWWNDQSDRWATMQRCRIVGAMVGAATSSTPSRETCGSTADRKLFLERYDEGYMPKSKRELEHSGPVPIDYSKMSQEQLEIQAHACGIKEPDASPWPGEMTPEEVRQWDQDRRAQEAKDNHGDGHSGQGGKNDA